MANSQSAKKAIRVADRKRVFNDRRRKTMRKVMKDITKLVREKKMDEAKAKLPEAYKAIDKATKRGVIKKNNAARKKAQMSRITKA
jgi:small subunit ribosomal protein S20